MDPIAIIGIILTIMLSGPAIKLAKRATSQFKRRKWSANQFRKGNIYNQRFFAFEEWTHEIKIDDEGNTIQYFNTLIVNLTQYTLNTLHIPLACDGNNISTDQISPWASSENRDLPVEFDTWDDLQTQGRFKITHVPPFKPGERRRVKWGFTLPQVFKVGDDYFKWSVEVPYYDMAGKLEFSKNWMILYARWDVGDGRHYDAPIIDHSTIRWRVRFPEPGKKLDMKLGLART